MRTGVLPALPPVGALPTDRGYCDLAYRLPVRTFPARCTVNPELKAGAGWLVAPDKDRPEEHSPD